MSARKIAEKLIGAFRNWLWRREVRAYARRLPHWVKCELEKPFPRPGSDWRGDLGSGLHLRPDLFAHERWFDYPSNYYRSACVLTDLGKVVRAAMLGKGET